ncbi:MAG: histone deacetylase [Dehalogenimonas sp.]|uniref:Histone deacetylase n=1 Tax=Candidatus Dehalogenimonas loeffleri TaxID=3127115 RepID=A0ABZ2J9M7_9CHLR|nr:histone deacetylase [Dehalogenimonas sp.]
MTTAIIYDQIFLKHNPGPLHPESPERLSAIMNHLTETGLLDRLTSLPARPAEPAELTAVHTADYLRMAEILGSNGGSLDVDTVLSADSWRTAVTAAGSAVAAVAAVTEGGVDGGCFVLSRPPGHHAFADRGSGFCLLNNVAVATRAALGKYGLGRAAIIDWDVHHGNGTQAIFEGDEAVFYVSLHQSPHYPGSGAASDTGRYHNQLNIPLPAGSGDQEYLNAFDKLVIPAIIRHCPDIILVSAGYDGHQADPLSAMNLSAAGFAGMTERVKKLAEEFCGGRLVLLLEGGYHPTATAESIAGTLRAMMGEFQ